MIINILKRIWNDRTANGWLFVELFIVFIILWYVIDFLFASLLCYYQPKGYDTSHVYHVTVAENSKLKDEYYGKDIKKDLFMQVYRLISEYPGVESASIYRGSVPYQGYMYETYCTDSLNAHLAYVRYVDKHFFDVFEVDFLDSNLEDWEIQTNPRLAVISADLAYSLFHGDEKLGAPFRYYYDAMDKFEVGGIAAMTKETEYDRYKPFIHLPFGYDILKFYPAPIAIRVKSEAGKGFANRFTEDMRDRLNIGPFFFSEILSYDEGREIQDTAMNNYIRTSVAVLLFFIFNVFLGTMGAFWFRTRKRRGEIGLRMALGAPPSRVSRELLLESILLLVIAVIPALLICLNVQMMNLTVNTLMDPTPVRFLVCILLTFVLMLLMVVSGVSYPARNAMRVHPAEALHEE